MILKNQILPQRFRRRRFAGLCPVPAALLLSLLAAGGMAGGPCADPFGDLVVASPFGESTILRPTGGPKILSTDHVIGDDDAPVTIVEYGDLTSASCGQFARNELPLLIEQFVNTGQARYVFRHFPDTSNRARSQNVAEASECASDQNLFFEFHDAVFADPEDRDFSDNGISTFAERAGLDVASFDDCVASGSKALRVQEDVTTAQALGVNTRPTFFINGERLAGSQTAVDLGERIGRKLNDLGRGKL